MRGEFGEYRSSRGPKDEPSVSSVLPALGIIILDSSVSGLRVDSSASLVFAAGAEGEGGELLSQDAHIKTYQGE